MATYPEIGEGTIRPHDLLLQLIGDVHRIFELLDKEKHSQFLRRIAVRNIFSFLEATVHIVKFHLKSDLRKNRMCVKLNSKEIEFILEEKIIERKKFTFLIPIDKNLPKTFQIAKKAWNLNNYKFSTSSPEYLNFKQVKLSRNKLTHPRTYYDIQITNEDMNDLVNTFIWIKSEFFKLMRAKMESDLSEIPVNTSNYII